MKLTVDLPSEQDTAILARALVDVLPGRFQLVALGGPLGAGKTTLVRSVVRALGVAGIVRSPTYTLCEVYDDCRPPIFHLDLYRLGDPEELEFLGLRDAMGSAAWVFVEWSERGAGWLPPADLGVNLAMDGDGRRAVVEGAAVIIHALQARLHELSELRAIVDKSDNKDVVDH